MFFTMWDSCKDESATHSFKLESRRAADTCKLTPSAGGPSGAAKKKECMQVAEARGPDAVDFYCRRIEEPCTFARVLQPAYKDSGEMVKALLEWKRAHESTCEAGSGARSHEARAWAPPP